MQILKQNLFKTAALLFASALLGAAIMVAIRFITYKSDTVHYHANFELYINGVRDEFGGPGYYEEVQNCTSDTADNPRTRVHMHNNVNNVVHVHAHGATWGQFFENLGYALSDTMVQTTNGVFVNGQNDGNLSFMLNGKPVEVVANQLIKNEDVLLISYGNDSKSAITKRYNAIPHDAHKDNERHDPASCAGSKPLTTWERLKTALGFKVAN